jgi:hypothetical protein
LSPFFRADGEDIDGCIRSPKEMINHNFVEGRSTTQGGDLAPALLQSRRRMQKGIGFLPRWCFKPMDLLAL